MSLQPTANPLVRRASEKKIRARVLTSWYEKNVINYRSNSGKQPTADLLPNTAPPVPEHAKPSVAIERTFSIIVNLAVCKPTVWADVATFAGVCVRVRARISCPCPCLFLFVLSVLSCLALPCSFSGPCAAFLCLARDPWPALSVPMLAPGSRLAPPCATWELQRTPLHCAAKGKRAMITMRVVGV